MLWHFFREPTQAVLVREQLTTGLTFKRQATFCCYLLSQSDCCVLVNNALNLHQNPNTLHLTAKKTNCDLLCDLFLSERGQPKDATKKSFIRQAAVYWVTSMVTSQSILMCFLDRWGSEVTVCKMGIFNIFEGQIRGLSEKTSQLLLSSWQPQRGDTVLQNPSS